MHVQARSAPALSPPDLEAFLKVLANDINIEGVSGCAVEDGGQIVFTVAHGQEAQAHELLTNEGYTVQWTTDLYAEEIPQETGPNQPGVLAGIVERAKGQMSGRPRDRHRAGRQLHRRARRLLRPVHVDGPAWESSPPEGEER